MPAGEGKTGGRGGGSKGSERASLRTRLCDVLIIVLLSVAMKLLFMQGYRSPLLFNQHQQWMISAHSIAINHPECYLMVLPIER